MIKKQLDERKIVIITGASAGIGEAAARALNDTYKVVIVGRSDKTARIAKELGVDYYLADFSDLQSVRQLAVDLLANYPRIDFLANNAGGVMRVIKRTKNGFESTFQVNYLAPVLLTKLLTDRLIESRGAVVMTSSAANRFARLKLDDLQVAKRPFTAYGNSKLLDLIYAKELAKRYQRRGLDAVSFHPGVVATNFASTSTGPISWVYKTFLSRILKTPAQGADTLVWLINNRPLWASGDYYANRKSAHAHKLASRPDACHQIWNDTEKLLQASEKFV